MSKTFNCIIMGAAGRDFHDFQTFFRDSTQFRVCAFTATQIPFIESRRFPKELAGAAYADDIPVYAEDELPRLIDRYAIDFVFLAYSDLSYAEVMHKASLVQSCGASFAMLGPRHTQLTAGKPVISVTAVRTGAGKSPLTQWLADYVTSLGRRTVVIRHPMPYGDLAQQSVQRFATFEDLDRGECTIEEREEYEPYVERGLVVFAGVDYGKILQAAEDEADVILWDGGNNDFPFIRPGLSLVVADALRSGHEVGYYPGEVNFRSANVIVINKVTQASANDVWQIRRHAGMLNPNAQIIEADLDMKGEQLESILGKRVLVVEDGPTLTHGGMPYGAGMLAARQFGAAEIVDPRAFAVGTIAEAFQRYRHIQDVLPALGYSPAQCAELERTINRSGADLVVDASPARLDRVLELKIPVVRVRYAFRQVGGLPLEELIGEFLG